VEDYSSYSFWLDDCGDDLTPRSPLPGDADVDIAIVGGGYTGLWTAYYLKQGDPALRIAILEKEICGFGASGRNGGWCSALFAASRDKIARSHGKQAAVAMQRQMFATVDEVGRVAAAEGIECDFAKGGTITAATAPSHLERIKKEVTEQHEWGFAESDYCWLDAAEAKRRIDVAGCLGAAFTPHCAALHPAKLVRGLARAVEQMGVAIYEQTAVTDIGDRRLTTSDGSVRADVVVRALEGYTPLLSRHKRTLVPLYSLMIATESLPEAFWDEVGWRARETFADGRHLIIYAQRTADGRIALGGRGAPYHFGSSVHDDHDVERSVFDDLRGVLVKLFPGAGDAAITHEWGGPLGVPRDWYSSVEYDKERGFAWAGGYVGDGVSTSNLAGRTLADLISGRDTDIARLPWVGHAWRNWEPEPLRWLGANLALKAMASADRAEARTGRPARRTALVRRLIGM
jgi:glycine/D-amino acid oxidase-like deaminating enzyme